MNFKSFFTKNSKKNKSHVRNLLEIALSDGSIDKEEMELLIKVAHKLGISKEEIDNIKENPSLASFYPPLNSRERFNQIYELVCMMMVNGEINPNELRLCKELALKLGYLPRIVDDFIAIVKQSIINGESIKESYSKTKKLVD